MTKRLPAFGLALLAAAAALGACSPAPVEKAPIEEAPVEEVSVEGAPVERAALEASPAEQETAGVSGPPFDDAAGEAAAAVEPLVVFLGDSLTAGLGVEEEEAFPEQVRLRLAGAGVAVRVVNAGISGDTTAGGRARLAWLLRQKPDVLVVGLGANDGLRGLALEETEANLRAILSAARDAGARVLLLGMMLPPNYGPEYTDGFREIFPRLAADLDVPLVPFLLTDVAGIPELNQADGIHPTAEGHRRMAGNVLPPLRALLESGWPGLHFSPASSGRPDR